MISVDKTHLLNIIVNILMISVDKTHLLNIIGRRKRCDTTYSCAARKKGLPVLTPKVR